MKITCLAENTSRPGLGAEHGLSLFIETEAARVLFDMGQSDLFARNAEKLGIDLNTADIAVLSHGHYDHGGGLSAFFTLNGHAPVYMSRCAFEPHYNGSRYIGLDPDLKASGRIRYTDGVLSVGEGLTLIPFAPGPAVAETDTDGLTVSAGGRQVPEDFRHEQYLLAEEKGKRVLFSGCSHRGILNIMHWFEPDVFVGGFHLFRLPADERLADIARSLDKYRTEYYTCHCTGAAQYEYMKGFMKNLRYLGAGDAVFI